MAYKCRICGANDVEHPGDVCELCAIGQDPYAQGMGGAVQPGPPVRSDPPGPVSCAPAPGKGRRKILVSGSPADKQMMDPYGNDMTVRTAGDDQVQVYGAGQTPPAPDTGYDPGPAASAAPVQGGPLTSGITKNISVDTQKRSFVEKWFRALFQGIPFMLDDEITMFQVFPDFTGTSLTASGTACDQVIVYGKLNAGAVAENNEVEVYGHRDSRNNIVVKTIRNKASGTTITPDRVIGAGVIWGATVGVILLAAVLLGQLGVTGAIWVAVGILCLMNLPLVLKVLGVIFGALFSLIFRRRD